MISDSILPKRFVCYGNDISASLADCIEGMICFLSSFIQKARTNLIESYNIGSINLFFFAPY